MLVFIARVISYIIIYVNIITVNVETQLGKKVKNALVFEVT